MSIGKIYKPSAGQFGSSVFKGLLGVTDSAEASLVKLRADGAQAFTKAFVEGQGYSVSVTLESNENQGYRLGQVGKLSFTLYEQAEGEGPVSGGGKTINYPASASTGNAILVAVSDPFPFEGKPAVSLSFFIYDAAGDQTLLKEFV